MRVLVTGFNGFIGKNLCSVLRRHEDAELFVYDLYNKPEDLDKALGQADTIFHLAGVNRPEDPEVSLRLEILAPLMKFVQC